MRKATSVEINPQKKHTQIRMHLNIRYSHPKINTQRMLADTSNCNLMRQWDKILDTDTQRRFSIPHIRRYVNIGSIYAL